MGLRFIGDRVALLLMNGVEFTASFFAIAKIGAIVVPLNWRLVADELAFILGDSGATVLIFDEELRSMVADLHRRGPDPTAAIQPVVSFETARLISEAETIKRKTEAA